MMKTVVVPVDGSPQDEPTVATGLRIARDANTAFRLVRVHVPLVHDIEALPPAIDDDFEALETSYLSQLAEGSFAEYGKSIDTTLLRGPIGEAIADDVARLDSPLVVMSTHGRTGFSRLWLGSVADAVVRQSTVPVLLLRIAPRGTTYDPAPLRFNRVVVPLDGSALAERIIEPAMTLAALDHGCIHLVRVLEQIVFSDSPFALAPPYVESMEDLDARRNDATAYLDAVAELVRRHVGIKDVSCEVKIDQRPAQAILETAKGRSADLIAVATHGRGASRLVIGSVADKLVRGSGCAVLLVRPPLESPSAG
jgi:nucleotide-binding universal stress UspA family protein